MYRTVTDIVLPVVLALVFIGAGIGLSISAARPTAPAAATVSGRTR